MTTLENYISLNASFRKKMVFNLGVEAGFYSEYNNMILGMLYCLQNKISFNLYSANANFRIDKGWTDYFLPFCEEESNKRHARYNLRRPNYRGRNHQGYYDLPLVKRLEISVKNAVDPLREKMLRYFYFRSSKPTNYFTHQLWDQFHSFDFQQRYFNIPELNIDGDIQQACSVLVNMTMRFNEDTRKQISTVVALLHLPGDYLGFHIRRGDKILEYDHSDVAEYISKAASLSSLRTAFILTDDYQIIREVKKDYPEWTVYTFCEDSEQGYDHKAFVKMTAERKRDKMVKLFASMEILASAKFFIGTYSSNPGMFLGMRMAKEKVHGVDFDSWRII